MPSQFETTETSKNTESTTVSTSEQSQKEVQNCQKTGLLKDIFQPKYSETTNSFLPDIIFTNTEAPDQKLEKQKSLGDFVRENKDVFDSDQDGEISQRELAKAAANPNLDKNVQAAVVALTKNYDGLANLTSESIIYSKSLTVNDIDEFCKIARGAEKTREQTELMDSVDGAFKQTINQFDNVNQDLFGPNCEISPKAVQQGGVGDCSFLAILAGMASTKSGRESISKMIKPDGDGYIVNFPNGESTRVEKPTPAELTLYAGNNGNGIWPAVLEKAYGQLLAAKHNKDVNAPQLAADGCEKFGPLNTMTSEQPCVLSVEPSKMDDEKLHVELSTMSRSSMVITAGTGPNVDVMVAAKNTPMAEQVDDQGNPIAGKDPLAIVGHHVYSIEKYDPETRSVYLRNPHDGTQLLKMPLSVYRQAFVAMSSVQEETLVDQPMKTDDTKALDLKIPRVA